MPDIVIRQCTLQDAQAVESLRVASWKAAYRGIVPGAFLDGMTVDAGRRRRMIAERACGCIESVAVQDGAITGWVSAGPCRDGDRAEPWHGEIYACYMLPGSWRGGIGRRLMAHATRALDEAGRGDVTLWVLERNERARRFYEACGFSPDGTRQFLGLLGEQVPEVRYRRPTPTPGR
jgi:ribosomal protein S18 acetylase RimI-like enzyme